ncbi:MAG TPA: acyl carrier protein [Vicinamibacterales bacterium]|nr:acyl carrier protein [Vicinamibacterales bacterium]
MTTGIDVLERVRLVIARVFGDDDVVVTRSTTASDVEGWDSVSNIEVLVALEREFAVRFNTGEMATLANVGQLVELIEMRLRRGED